MNKKILICGDSFSASSTEESSWTNLLKQHFTITNLSKRGCSEFNIYKQVISQDLSKYDFIIVSHTSPFRLHTLINPIHINDVLYKDSSFIYNDVKEHSLTDSSLKPIVDFFEKYFDLDYAEYMHNLTIKDIEKLCPDNTLHLSHLEWKNLYKCSNHLDFNNLFYSERGNINHYTSKGNQIVYQTIKERLL